MIRLRCKLGLHQWEPVDSQRADRHTVECRYCRFRYSKKLPVAEDRAKGPPLNKADRAPSSV